MMVGAAAAFHLLSEPRCLEEEQPPATIKAHVGGGIVHCEYVSLCKREAESSDV